MLSVIIPVWSLTPDLARMATDNTAHLRKVAEVPTEILWIDNGSPHYTGADVDYYCRWTENRGIAPAWNHGVERSYGDVLCFLNSDVRVEPGWDTALCKVATAGPYIAMPYTNGGKGVAGWCFALTRANFKKVGPFDETFVPAYYEDTDFFHRAIQAGLSLVNVPEANVGHQRQTTTAHAPWYPQRDLLFMANRFRFGWKHGLDPADIPALWQKPLPDISILL